MEEGRRGVDVDDIVGEEAPAGWRTEQGVGFHCWSEEVMAAWDFKWRKGGNGRGNHDLGTRLSKM